MRQFISGMGVGILVATFVLAITYMLRGNDISDSEVVRRAKQLGMVENEPRVVRETQEGVDEENVSNGGAGVSDVSVAEPDGAETGQQDLGQQDAVQPGDGQPQDIQPEPTTDMDTSEVVDSSEPLQSVEPLQTDGTVLGDMVEVTIPKGMDGVTVSFLLEEKGVVENAMDFNRYLSDHQLQGYIMYGTYNLKKNSAYEELEKEIIRK